MEEQAIINELLCYNLKKFAFKLGFVEEVEEFFPTSKAAFLLNVAEQYSRKVLKIHTDDRNDLIIKALFICGLLWENQNPEWVSLNSFISRILIRVGLNPSALMVGGSKQTRKFNDFGSVTSNIYASFELNEGKVTVANKKTLILSDFQKRLWNSIGAELRLGISAPTSAGKSFIITNRVVDIINSLEKAIVIYVVPTLSLINQVCNDFKKLISELNLDDIEIFQNINEVNLNRQRAIFVLTQERLESALTNPKVIIQNLEFFIIDEIQNVERFGNDSEERATIMFDGLLDILETCNPMRVIVSGPRIANIDQVTKSWFGESAKTVSESIPPLLNLTYTFSPSRRKAYVSFIQEIDPRVGAKQFIEIEDKFQLNSKVFNYRTVTGGESIKFIYYLNDKLKNENGTIIFAGTSPQANKLAIELSSLEMFSNNTSPLIDSLKEYIAETVHGRFNLIKAIDKGILYHHGKIPQHLRYIIEQIFRDKTDFEEIKTIISTTTLLQGINMPAKNLIINDLKLYSDISLSDYEFSNLKGRTGRLMQDFLGRTIILNSKNFGVDQLHIFENKELQPERNIGNKYFENRGVIEYALENQVSLTPDLEGSNLVLYIRQLIYKHKENAKSRLEKIGIPLPDQIYNSIQIQMNSLEVPEIVCLQNPFWDPFDLEFIYQNFDNYPNYGVNSMGNLKAILEKFKEEIPYYFKKYLDKANNDKYLQSCIIMSSQLLRNKPLSEIINFNIKSSNDIDSNINRLYTDVMFKMPKLLKPYISIKNFKNKNEDPILSFLEFGTSDKLIISLIEMGIPREIALRIYNLVPKGKKQELINKPFLKDLIKSEELNYWDKVVLNEVV